MCNESNNDILSGWQPKNEPYTIVKIFGNQIYELYNTVARAMTASSTDEGMTAQEVLHELGDTGGFQITVENIEEILTKNNGTKNGRYYFVECVECGEGKYKCIDTLKIGE